MNIKYIVLNIGLSLLNKKKPIFSRGSLEIGFNKIYGMSAKIKTAGNIPATSMQSAMYIKGTLYP
jgi:hypothetical protein